jgi:hypothetical protein
MTSFETTSLPRQCRRGERCSESGQSCRCQFLFAVFRPTLNFGKMTFSDKNIGLLATLLKRHDASSVSATKAITKKALLKQVRKCVRDHQLEARLRCAMLFSPITWNSIVFEGVTVEYTCPMTAFQAQKAPKDKRTSYAKLGPGEAAAQGRAETIDCTMWDANRVKLMTHILKSLAKQHDSGDTEGPAVLRCGARHVGVQHHAQVKRLQQRQHIFVFVVDGASGRAGASEAQQD